MLVVRVVCVTGRGKLGDEDVADAGGAIWAGAGIGCCWDIPKSRLGSNVARGSGLPAVSESGSELCRQVPSKNAPISTASTS